MNRPRAPWPGASSREEALATEKATTAPPVALCDPAVRALLSDPASFPGHPGRVEVIETHMSFVFIGGEHVYKLKKAIRLGEIDFTTLEARRLNCERELSLNQRLAPGTYLKVVPVVRQADGPLAIEGNGVPVEWIVVMRRLDQASLLDSMVIRGEASPAHIDRLCSMLARFYREAPVIDIPPSEWIAAWREGINLIDASLSDPLFALPVTSHAEPVGALRSFVNHHSDMLAARLAAGRIVDGHGDLRPEHVLLGPAPQVIDRLEFSARLRRLDPMDEASFLGMECERLGAVRIGPRLVECLARQLNDDPPERLLRFYRCYRACLRARLSIEHLRDRNPRTPQKWPQRTREYLALANQRLP